MKKIILLFSFFTILTELVRSQPAGNIILVKGEKFIVENKGTTVMSMNMLGQSMESNANFSSIFKIEVANVNDTSYNLKNTISKMKSSISGMGQQSDFDSDKKEDMDGDIGQSLKEIVNIPHDVLMSKSGQVIAVKKERTDTIRDPNPMKEMMKQFTGNPEETGYGASSAFVNIPKNSTVGYTWGDSSSESGITRSTTYTIAKIESGEATVNIAGDMLIEMKTEMQGGLISSKSKGIIKGTEIINIKTGIVKQIHTTLESSGTVEAMGQEIPVNTTVTSITTVQMLQ